jgi:hypothetical protein
MARSWPPKPDPFGELGPPRRNPPTAVGLATPPPPAGRPLYYDLHVSRRRRLASAFLGTVLAASATTLATLGSVWWALLSTGLGALGGVMLYQAGRRVRRVRIGHESTLARLHRRFNRKHRHAA